MKGIIAWLLGVPLIVIILLYVFHIFLHFLNVVINFFNTFFNTFNIFCNFFYIFCNFFYIFSNLLYIVLYLSKSYCTLINGHLYKYRKINRFE